MTLYNESIQYNATGIPYAGIQGTSTTGTGSITLTGSAVSSSTYSVTGTGSISLVGSATSTLSFATTGNGSLTLIGTALNQLIFISTGSGSIQLSAIGQAILGAGTITSYDRFTSILTANPRVGATITGQLQAPKTSLSSRIRTTVSIGSNSRSTSTITRRDR